MEQRVGEHGRVHEREVLVEDRVWNRVGNHSDDMLQLLYRSVCYRRAGVLVRWQEREDSDAKRLFWRREQLTLCSVILVVCCSCVFVL